MARRSRAPKPCEAACGRPVRRVRGARWCSPCVAKQGKRTCGECGEDFYPDMMRGPRCKTCASKKAHAARVEKTYGITGEQYAELLEFQGGGDAVTGQKPRAKRLAVDHDHTTGEVRGLLLKHTNFYVIGWLESFDDPFEILDNLRAYLENPPARRLWGEGCVPRQQV